VQDVAAGRCGDVQKGCNSGRRRKINRSDELEGHRDGWSSATSTSSTGRSASTVWALRSFVNGARFGRNESHGAGRVEREDRDDHRAREEQQAIHSNTGLGRAEETAHYDAADPVESQCGRLGRSSESG
jgi:hypothetical protein